MSHVPPYIRTACIQNKGTAVLLPGEKSFAKSVNILSFYYAPGTVLGVGNTDVIKADKNSCPQGADILVWETHKEINSPK